jgi:beta-lactamase class A
VERSAVAAMRKHAGMRRLTVIIAVVLLAAACGGSERAEPTTTTTTVATTTTTIPTTTTEPASAVAARLQAAIDGYVGTQAVPFSVVAVDLTSGARASHLGDRRLLSASLYKLFVAAELERRIAEGLLDRTRPAGDGQGRTIDQCIEAMIVVSDDPCGVAGLQIIGRGAHDHALRAAGYASTSLANPQQTTADDVALFLQRAHDGTLLGEGTAHVAATKHLYGLLERQQVNDRLPTGLPPGTPIAHKTGDRRTVAHDAGIITTSRGPLLLAVLTGPWAQPCCDAARPGPAEARAFAAIAGVARVVYEVMEATAGTRR